MKIYGVTGWKNAGKTGLMERLVAEFTARGLTVATIKHAHHRFDVDHPGKDSFRHRAAGAGEVILTSSQRWAHMGELRGAEEPPLGAHLARLGPCDLVLIEGYKSEDHPKIEAHRVETGAPLIAPGDARVRAVAADGPVSVPVPVFDLNDTGAIADFIAAELGLSGHEGGQGPAPSPAALLHDCFAPLKGDAPLPVAEALARLRAGVSPVTGARERPTAQALGRILARDAQAARSNPAADISAVDGYGFAHGAVRYEIDAGRSAAGAAFDGAVPAGHALRVLTGAVIPPGVDTVIMQEDVDAAQGGFACPAGLAKGANIRRAGEDFAAGATLMRAGTRLGPAQIALLTAAGVEHAHLRAPLRVGVLSTGDELRQPGQAAGAHQIYDANRPMLLGLLRAWGHETVDLGHVGDGRETLQAALDGARGRVDAIVTSGGASAGAEDHVSALLSEAGQLAAWRVAMKPGKPLVLALWQGLPLFGLPGNPVSALTCALIFARPALSVLAGGAWLSPAGVTVPAAFERRKKAGRREFLRARLSPEGAEIYHSDGSGRLAGLHWAEGLIELPEEAIEITPGTPVRYIPLAGLGL